MDLLDGAKSCSWGNFVMALQACLSLFWRSLGRGGKKVYPVRAKPAMHARLAFPSPSLPYQNICIIKGEESSHHSQPLLLPIHPREIQGDMIEQEGARIVGKMFIASGCFNQSKITSLHTVQPDWMS